MLKLVSRNVIKAACYKVITIINGKTPPTKRNGVFIFKFVSRNVAEGSLSRPR